VLYERGACTRRQGSDEMLLNGDANVDDDADELTFIGRLQELDRKVVRSHVQTDSKQQP